MGNFTWYNICIIGLLEGEVKANGAGEMFEVLITYNFPKLLTNTKHQIHKFIHRTLTSINMIKNKHGLIIFKLHKIKDKEKILQNKNHKELSH